ncbi:MAG: hypothetical protein ACRCV5_07215, partial [Afipia sp.]
MSLGLTYRRYCLLDLKMRVMRCQISDNISDAKFNDCGSAAGGCNSGAAAAVSAVSLAAAGALESSIFPRLEANILVMLPAISLTMPARLNWA